MGFFDKILAALGLLKKEAKIIVIGLDNSGKSTLINHLKPKKAASYELVPTVGFSVERFERASLKFTVMDMSGAGTYRNLWETYYSDVQAIIFVIDSSDKIRMCVAKDELDAMMGHADIRKGKAPILFYANKMDMPGSLDPTDVSLLMGLPQIQDRAWQIQASNALSGDGVDAGVAWLAEQLIKAPQEKSGAGSSDAKEGKAAAPAAGSSASAGSSGGAAGTPAKK